MAPLRKERAASLTLSVIITLATVAGNGGGKVPVFEVSKSDSFVESRFKFKAFYTQVRLGI
jgi:hypothetical protein